jgi:hypothetical protein
VERKEWRKRATKKTVTPQNPSLLDLLQQLKSSAESAGEIGIQASLLIGQAAILVNCEALLRMLLGTGSLSDWATHETAAHTQLAYLVTVSRLLSTSEEMKTLIFTLKASPSITSDEQKLADEVEHFCQMVGKVLP